MTTFFDLFTLNTVGGGADHAFPEAVENSPLQLWGPGDPIPQHAVRLLIGVATSSASDMRLLDVISEAMARGPSALPIVDVFNTAYCPRRRTTGATSPRCGRSRKAPSRASGSAAS